MVRVVCCDRLIVSSRVIIL